VSHLAVLTPSYAPDLELCRDLNRSVLEHTAEDVVHHVVVPRRDRAAFSLLGGPRTRIWTVDELIPSHMLAVPRANLWLNARRPWPPVRGWVMQQVVKLEMAARLEADVLLLADSDVVLVRPVDDATFRDGDSVRFFRREGAVTARMERHVRWHAVARRLLGLPAPSPPPLPDYVSAFNVWEREVLVELRRRVEDVTGRPWLDAIAAELHVSEFILYGVFVDEILAASRGVRAVESMLCHDYWHPRPLDLPAAHAFVRARSDGDVAIMISAKSGTPLDVRRSALADAVRRATADAPVS